MRLSGVAKRLIWEMSDNIVIPTKLSEITDNKSTVEKTKCSLSNHHSFLTHSSPGVEDYGKKNIFLLLTI